MEAPVSSGPAFVSEELLEMLRIEDLLAPGVRARVLGEELLAIEDPHPMLAGEERDGPLHMTVRHRVVVEVETHDRRLSDLDLHSQIGFDVVSGKLKQSRPFLGQGAFHGSLSVLRPGSALRPLAPFQDLPIQTIQIAHRSGAEERASQEADCALDAAFGLNGRMHPIQIVSNDVFG